MKNTNDLIKKFYPNGVGYIQLKDISVMQRGKSITKKDLIKGKVPVISGGKEPAFYCNISNRDGETITVAGSGASAGYVQYWNMPIFVNDAFSIKAKSDSITKYIYYCLSNLQTRIYETKTGSGIPHVNISDIENFKIPFPSLKIQREITKILSTQDKLIELKQKLIDGKKQQKKWLMQNLLTGKIRLKGFEGEWEKIIIKNIGELISIVITPKELKDKNVTLYSLPSFDIGKNPEYISGNSIESNKFAINGNLILFNKLNVHKQRVWNIKNVCSAICSTEFLPLRIHNCNQDYIYMVLSSEKYTNYFVNCSSGTSNSQKRISPDDLMTCTVNIPSIEEQTAIAEILSAQDREIELLKKQLEQEKLKKKFLMNLLLSVK